MALAAAIVAAKQRPRAGAEVDDGSKVDLWVSRGPLHIPSPDLTGMRSAATALLARESLTTRKRKAATRSVLKGEIYRQEPAAGWGEFPGDVVEQDPFAGSRLRKGDEVVIKVAVF